jgi:hypothetical protein
MLGVTLWLKEPDFSLALSLSHLNTMDYKNPNLDGFGRWIAIPYSPLWAKLWLN